MKIKRIRPSLNLLMSQSEPVYGTPIQYLNLDEPTETFQDPDYKSLIQSCQSHRDQVEYLEQLRAEAN